MHLFHATSCYWHCSPQSHHKRKYNPARDPDLDSRNHRHIFFGGCWCSRWLKSAILWWEWDSGQQHLHIYSWTDSGNSSGPNPLCLFNHRHDWRRRWHIHINLCWIGSIFDPFSAHASIGGRGWWWWWHDISIRWRQWCYRDQRWNLILLYKPCGLVKWRRWWCCLCCRRKRCCWVN